MGVNQGAATVGVTTATEQALATHVRERLSTNVRKHWMLYVMVIPGIIWFVMFRLIPDAGSVIAFQDYNMFKGVAGSEWVGLAHFRRLLDYPDFYRILSNTLIMGFLTVLFGWPVPVILALGINEVRVMRLRRGLQTMLYLPHFFSWVVIAGLFFQVLSLNGVVNTIIVGLGGERIFLVQQQWFFRPMIVIASLYRDSGYGTIVYLAAIASISPELYESAMIDGASKLQQVVHVTIPLILPTAFVLLLLRIGNFMQLGFDRIWNFLTPLTWSVGDVFDTYVYRVGITEGQYSLTTAIGLFQSLVGLILIYGFNRLTKKVSGGLW
ncbi:MAG: ABC transporter permease [Spirochaetota bacterium]